MNKTPIIILAFFALAQSAQAQQPNYQAGDTLNIFTIAGLKLRESHSLSSRVLASMKLGEKVVVQSVFQTDRTYYQVIEGFTGHWVKIKYDTLVGFAFDGFLSALPVPRENIISKENRSLINKDDSYRGQQIEMALQEYIQQEFPPVCEPVFAAVGVLITPIKPHKGPLLASSPTINTEMCDILLHCSWRGRQLRPGICCTVRKNMSRMRKILILWQRIHYNVFEFNKFMQINIFGYPLFALLKNKYIRQLYKKRGVNDPEKAIKKALVDPSNSTVILQTHAFMCILFFILLTSLSNFISSLIKIVLVATLNKIAFLLIFMGPSLIINHYALWQDDRYLVYFQKFQKENKEEKRKWAWISTGVILGIFILLIGSCSAMTFAMHH